MKYLAQVTQQNNQGCYRLNSDSLEEIRGWAKKVGKPGDELTIQPNGKNALSARKFII